MIHNTRATLKRSQGWLVIIIVTCIPMVIWLGTADLPARFSGSAATLKSLANLAALTGTAMFAANMLLAARTRSAGHSHS